MVMEYKRWLWDIKDGYEILLICNLNKFSDKTSDMLFHFQLCMKPC